MAKLVYRIDDAPAKNEATLLITTDRLEPDHIVEFQTACKGLVATGRKKLVINLCGFQSLPSVIIGAVADTHTGSPDRQVVVAVDGATADLFRKLFHRFLNLVEPSSGG